MMKYVGPGEALSAEKPTNGQEQLVFPLTGHTVLNAILSSPALRDTHTPALAVPDTKLTPRKQII